MSIIFSDVSISMRLRSISVGERSIQIFKTPNLRISRAFFTHLAPEPTARRYRYCRRAEPGATPASASTPPPALSLPPPSSRPRAEPPLAARTGRGRLADHLKRADRPAAPPTQTGRADTDLLRAGVRSMYSTETLTRAIRDIAVRVDENRAVAAE